MRLKLCRVHAWGHHTTCLSDDPGPSPGVPLELTCLGDDPGPPPRVPLELPVARQGALLLLILWLHLLQQRSVTGGHGEVQEKGVNKGRRAWALSKWGVDNCGGVLMTCCCSNYRHFTRKFGCMRNLSPIFINIVSVNNENILHINALMSRLSLTINNIQ